jgi:serine/threonine-protein kinase
MANSEHELPEGTLVDGRYEIRKLIGSGGMGAVYRANDMKTGHRIALKMLHAGSGRRSPRDEERQRRLLQEVVLSGRVDHKNVVKVQDFGFHKGTPYIVMEFLDGKDLAQVAEQNKGPLPVEYVVDVMLAVCSALRACHGANVVHRDLKPSNIMVIDSQSGLGWDIKVVDFSISKVLLEDDITEEGRVLGTVHYLAPEQFENRAGPATDQYAIGVLLYVLLTKQLPYGRFSGHSLHQAIMKGEFTDPRELRPDLPGKLCDVIVRAMKRRPEDRFPSVFELGQALWEFGSRLGRENWKKYYFHQTPNIASAKMSSVGVPLIRKILDGGVALDNPTALAHYQSTTAVLDGTIHDAGVPVARPDTQIDSKPVTRIDQGSSATAIDATIGARARIEGSPGQQASPVGGTARASGIEIAPIPLRTGHSGDVILGKRRASKVVLTLIAAAALGGGAVWFVERGAPRLHASSPSVATVPAQPAPPPPVAVPSPAPITAAAPAPQAVPVVKEGSNSAQAERADAPSEADHRSASGAHHHHHAGSEAPAADSDDGRTAADLVTAADAAFDRGNFDQAVSLARKATRKDGGSEEGYLILGDVSFRSNDFSTARGMYGEALKRNPSSSRARHRLDMVAAKEKQAANRQP